MKKAQPKILIAGHEIGGQMQLLAETFRSKGILATAAAFNQDFREFINDINIPQEKIPIDRFLFAQWAIRHYDVFHFFWGVSLFDAWKFHGLDLPLLKLFKKKIVVHFRGTDVVDIRYYQYLLEKAQGDTNHSMEPPISRVDQVKKIKHWKKYADAILVSTPDLLEIVGEGSILIPQVIKMNEWNALEKSPPISPKTIRIAHAPTRRLAKGTDIIIKAIDDLKSEGYPVELVLVENMHPQKVKEIFATCDIGIDQLLYGWYGKVSVELMALGKPVICYIKDKLIEYRPDMPIIVATPVSIKSVLKELITNQEKRVSLGDQSREYVRKYHDVSSVVDNLLDLYSSL